MAWIITVLILIAAILIISFDKRNYKEKISKELYKEDKTYKEQLRERKERALQEYRELEEGLKEKTELTNQLIAQDNEKRRILLTKGKENVNAELKHYKDFELMLIDAEIKQEEETIRANSILQRMKIEAEIEEERRALEDFSNKRKVINEALLRERAIKEERDFYRIIIPEQDKKDITYLFSIENNINNKQLLYKFIWSEFLLRPFGEMVKRVTQGREIKDCIYKITNLITKEIYIGKTKMDVAKRWTDHIKTSLDIGVVSRTLLHSSMKKYFWDSFSFEVLEYGLDDLAKREKYWIEFYQSNIYGMNIKSG